MANFIVTITGADDAVNPYDLIALSEKYEFVEWGILFSSTAYGKDRYPTIGWRKLLYAAAMSAGNMVNLSAHLCGRFVDERLASTSSIHTEVETFFRRIQFNRFNADNAHRILKYSTIAGAAVIVPYNSNTRSTLESIKPEYREHISVLFDGSGGRGISPTTWPESDPYAFCCGYAGGINEDNVENVLTELVKGNEKFWIDLETGARTNDDKFDIAKVERILEKASKFYGDKVEKEKSSIILLS
jgi:phosphoribosylanthranilate isomerase